MIGNKSAYEEWLRNHKKGENWEPLWAEFTNKNHPIVMLVNAEKEYCLSVQRNGNGKYFNKYFNSVSEAYTYFQQKLKE